MDFFNETDPMLETVLERDIDLLIIEELSVSESFQRFIFEQMIPEGKGRDLRWEDVKTVIPKHSVSFFLRKPEEREGLAYEGRETDIEVRFVLDGSTPHPEHILFMENKVNAQYTNEQPESYLGRVHQARQKGAAASSMLVAPQEYIDCKGNAECFDAFLSYEAIDRYFNFQMDRAAEYPETSRRYLYKQMLLRQAIEKWRRKGPVQVNEEVTAFRTEYDRQIIEKAPQLMHKAQGDIGNDIWVNFGRCLEGGKKKGRYLKHKLERGKVDLHVKVPDLYARWDEIASAISPLLEPGMELPVPKKRDKSFKVSIDVPVFQPYEPLAEESLADVDRAIEAIDRLRLWHNRNRAVLEEIG